jgi:FKBP-type peptidyl-prolyl cis-trans isomerase SlyD
MKIDNNCAVALHYTLSNDQGEELDSSAGHDPLEYLHGGAGIVPGLENALTGKEVGDKFVVVIQPEDAYGESQPELMMVVPRTQFPEEQDIEVGMTFQAQNSEGEQQMLSIRSVEGDEITVDGNHPLAGQVLHFDVSVENVRAATEEEVAQGHPD